MVRVLPLNHFEGDYRGSGVWALLELCLAVFVKGYALTAPNTYLAT